ncbi:MAG: DUF2007 domain-containing protein [Fibrobacterales bacterium]
MKQVYNTQDYATATIIQQLLVNSEIEAEVFDDGAVSADPFLINVTQGIKVMVRDEDYKESLQIIDEQMSSEPDTKDDDVGANDICPECNSINIKNDGTFYKNGLLFIGVATAVVFLNPYMLIGWLVALFSFRFFNFKYRCYSCKHKWRVYE